jgi:uncharacterized membrane-anchored protein YhcB (DUF1043 family)
MMLAEISPGEMAMTAATIGLFVVALIALLKKQEVKVDQPLDVSLVETLATKADLKEHIIEDRTEHANLFSKIGGMDRGMAQKISNEVTAIHARINLLDRSNGRLEATTELQNAQLKSLDDKLDAMPERVIATLKNTNAI